MLEDLDVMERSPHLSLRVAAENLEPRSISYGLNSFVDQFAVAMKRSTSPNTASKNTNTGSERELQPIESAPRDGGFLILEEDVSGKYDIARWAPEAGGWVRESGEPIKITPSYWYPIQGQNHLRPGLDISTGASQPEGWVAPEQRFAGDIITSRSAALPKTAATAKIDTTAVEPRRASRARNRFAVFSIAASLVVAVCVGMYFRGEQESLLQERDRVAALTRELATAREEADRLRQAANAATAELEQERSRSAALARDLESANQTAPTKQDARRELRRRRH
jgi:hypothetical protein